MQASKTERQKRQRLYICMTPIISTCRNGGKSSNDESNCKHGRGNNLLPRHCRQRTPFCWALEQPMCSAVQAMQAMLPRPAPFINKFQLPVRCVSRVQRRIHVAAMRRTVRRRPRSYGHTSSCLPTTRQVAFAWRRVSLSAPATASLPAYHTSPSAHFPRQ